MIDFGSIDLDNVADAIATGADIVGLGESTRFAHETFAIRDQLFRRLVRDHRFRVLAVQDDASAAQTGWLDLRADGIRHRWDGPAKARVNSGVYETSRDAAEHLAVASLPEAFDVLVQVNEVSPVHGQAA